MQQLVPLGYATRYNLAFGEFVSRRGRQADVRPYLELFLKSASSDQDAREVEKARRLLAQPPR